LFCRNCNTAHQKYQVVKTTLFPHSYHYRSRFTADVLSGMASIVDSAEKRLGSLQGKTILDIGCNDGSLLDQFSAKGAITIGVEPTDAYADAEGRGHVVLNEFFSELSSRKILDAHPVIDIITFANVFAHIENLPALLEALTPLIGDGTILLVENHYLGAVLEGNQFDTFYHEHPRTYSVQSFMHIAKTLGREVIDVEFPRRYGGNVRVTIGKPGMAQESSLLTISQTLKREEQFFEQFADLRAFISSWQQAKKVEIQGLVRAHGRLVAKAFPGRAAILVALLGLSDAEIECVYEKPGSLKIGHYLPGTRIPIRSDEEMFPRLAGMAVLLNFAWHIPEEIEDYLNGGNFRGQLVHIV
jgi:SAM-dependent methyltransferase